MISILVILLAAIGVSESKKPPPYITIMHVDRINIPTGFINNASIATTISFDTSHQLADLRFYMDHGDGQRDWNVSLTGKEFNHTYNRRGVYKARVTVLLTSDNSFESVDYTVNVGNVQVLECYPMALLENASYTMKYEYKDSGGIIVSESSSFTTPGGSEANHTITPEANHTITPEANHIITQSVDGHNETILNPCNSVIKASSVANFSVLELKRVIMVNDIVTPERAVTFTVYSVANITKNLTTCKINFGDRKYSEETEVPKHDPNDLIATWSHTYLATGTYNVAAFCWDNTSFAQSNVVITEVVSTLSFVELNIDESVVDLSQKKEIQVKMNVNLQGASDIIDTTFQVDWSDGPMFATKVLQLKDGDNLIPNAKHKYTTPGLYDINVSFGKTGESVSFQKKKSVTVSESIELQLVLVQLNNVLRSEEPLAVNITNATTYDISYILDFGDATIPKIKYNATDFTAAFTSFPPRIEFTYNFGGNFTITLSANNGVFNQTLTLALDVPQGVPKTGWSLAKSNSNPIIVDESEVEFVLLYSINKASVPTILVDCQLVYGDENTEKPTEVEFPDQVKLEGKHKYNKVSNFTVELACRKGDSAHTLSMEIDVLTYTKDNYTFLYTEALGINGTLETANTAFTNFGFSLYGTTEVLNHLYKFNFGNGEVMTKRLRTWEMSYLYKTRGIYDGIVYAETPKGNFSYAFKVYIGITELIINPTACETNTSIEITFNELRRRTFSSYISFGDGNSKTRSCKSGSCKYSHVFDDPDFYDVTTMITVGNIVERLIFPEAIFIDNAANGLYVETTESVIHQPPGEVIVEIKMHNNSKPIKYMKCYIDLGDALNRKIHQRNGSITPETKMSLWGRYMSMGEQNIIVNCSNRVGWQVVTTSCVVQSECFGGEGIFEKLYADPKTPLLIMASTEVEITSRAILKCITNPINFTWSLWTLREETFDSMREIPIHQPHRDSYRIHKGFLEPMLYSLELNVSTVSKDELHWLYGLTYIRIIGSPLIVKFKGGSIRATGNDKAVVNAEQMSFDPDKTSKDEYNMTFTWECRYFNTRTVADLDLAVERFDPGESISCDNFSIEISPGIRQFNNMPDAERGYMFEVDAKSGGKTSEESAIAYVQYTKGAPELEIECVVNCEVKRARTSPQMMEVRCPYCFLHEFYSANITWTLLIQLGKNKYQEESNFKNMRDFIDDNPIAILIKKNTLQPCKKYRLKVVVDMSTRKSKGEAFTDFTVNCPPTKGKCVTRPKSGEARSTKFRTICTGWVDDGYGPSEKVGPAAFIYKFYISQGIYVVPLFQGAQSLTPEEALPVIPGTKGGKYTIISRIIDALFDYAEFNTTVDLTVPTLHSLDEIGNADEAEFTSGVAKDTSVLSKQLVMTTYSSSILQTVEVNSLNSFTEELNVKENASWLDVFGKFMASRKDKGMKIEITKKYKMFMGQVKEKWKNVTALDGYGLEAMGETLATIMHTQDTVDYEISNEGNDLINSGTAMLESLSAQEPFPIQDKVDDVIFAMAGALDTVYNKNTPTYQTADVPIKINAEGMSDDEKQMLSLMILKEQALVDEEKMEQGKAMLETVENSTATLLNAMLKDQTMGQLSKNIKRQGVSLTARKITARTLKNSGFQADDFGMDFPGAHNESMNVTDMLFLKASVTKKNLFSFSKDGSSYDVTSPVLSLRMDDTNGTNHFDGNVTLKIKRPMPDFKLCKANETRQGKEGLFHHQFQVKKPSERTFVFIDIGKRGNEVGAYIRYGHAPVSYVEDKVYVQGEYVTYNSGKRRRKRGASSVIKFTFEPGELKSGFVYFGINFGEMADTIQEYYFLAYSDSCRVWDRENNVWSNESCKISPYSTPEETLCDCVDAPGHNFASSFYVPPNLINFDLVFGKFDAENAAVYGTLIGLFVVFGIGAIWAKRKGRLDEKKWGVGYLKDNFIGDQYFYLLTVHTGLTGSSGTTSLVSFILTGDKGDTGVRLLSDGVRHLETGAIMTFVMATSESVGELKFLRIWHDNSGEGADQSWYLSKFVVEDIQSNTRSVFVCDEWLALDKADGLLDRVIPVAFEDDLMSFSKLFSEHNRVNISDTHLWLSIILRPERSMFTRVQRVFTCHATLLLAMISSAMFYKAEDPEGNSPNNAGSEVQLGSMRFSMTTLFTATIGLLITVPPIMLIVFFFKSRRPWTKKFSCCGCCCSRRNRTIDLSDSGTESELSTANSECALHSRIDRDPLSRKYEKNILPPSFLIVAWTLVILIILICSFCLVLYSMQWGKAVSEEWLASFALSFFESIFIMDPLKVLLFSTLLALCMRNPQGETNSDKLSIDVIKEQSSIHGCAEIDPTILPPDPIPEELLEKARERKRQEALANRVFVELILYVFFVFCVFSLSYGNRDARSYNLHNHLMNQLINPPFRKYDRVYYGSQEEAFTWSKLRTVDDIYLWLNSSMQDNMFPWNSLNGAVLPWQDRQYMKDMANYRVGAVRIRQARMPRVPPHSIKSEPSFTGPYITNQDNLLGKQDRSPSYSINDEEIGDYCWQWKAKPCSKKEKMEGLTASAWMHRTTRQEKSFPVIGKFAVYSGAAYVFDLNFNKQVITQLILKELLQNSWLNIQTRAFFIEFTLYNVNVNLLTSVRLAAEIPEYGGIFTWSDVKPMRVYDHTGGLGAMILICQIIAVFVTIYFTVKVCKKLREMKCQFFREIWNVLDLFIVTLCLAALVLYVTRKVLVTKVMDSFKRDPKAFANFYEAAFCDDIYGWILAFVVFLCTLRIMRILGYNKRILMIATVLERAGPGLFSFSLLFGVIIIAFMSTGFALFQANLESFMTLWDSYVTILYLLLGKNVFKKMVMVNAILSRVYFFLLSVIVVFIFLTIFQAILNFTITEVNTDVSNAPVPYGVMNILQKFYASVVLDNKVVEMMKRWSASKSPDGVKKVEPEKSKPVIETDMTHIHKVFSVLRDHVYNTMEDSKKLTIDRSESNADIKEPQNGAQMVSPRDVNIHSPTKKQKRKKKKYTETSKSGNTLEEPELELDIPSPSHSSISNKEDNETIQTGQEKQSKTLLAPPPKRSIWASGIKRKF